MNNTFSLTGALRLLLVALALVGKAAAETPAERGHKPLFTPEEVRAYVPKGPSVRYRHFCSAYHAVFGPLDAYLSKADPAEYAEFHVKLHADAALILAVPHEGYCVYPSEIGPTYRSCVDRDFLGLTIQELRQRDISAFAYVTLGWNARYLKAHPEFDDGGVACFCSPYLDLIVAYSQEILRKYPIDGLRWDILWQNGRCRCEGCKQLYRERFGEELPADWKTVGWKRLEWFKEAKVAQAVRRLHEACKAVKPAVEIWHNQLNIDHDNPLSAMKYVDLAYIEYGDPWGLLFHNSATPKKGFIVGKLESLGFRTMRLCLALGGHGYTYIMARHDTALPPVTEEEADQWRRQRGWTSASARDNARSRAETIARLAPFYEMLSQAQPYYEDGRPVYHGVGVVFCDATRYRYPNFSRAQYTDRLKTLGNAYLKQSLALEYLSSDMLPERDLSRFRLVVLPETSGLRPLELDALRAYVRAGGKLLVTGDALRHDEQGEPMNDFALAAEMGTRFSDAADLADLAGPWQWASRRENGERAIVEITRAGENTVSIWPRKSNYRIDQIILFSDLDYMPTPGTLTTLASNPDLISFEAESFRENIPRGGTQWAVSGNVPQQAGFSGKGYVGISGGKDFSKTEGYETQAPELQYKAVFPKPGKWFLWVRQNSTPPAGIFVGVNGKRQTDVEFAADSSNSRNAEGIRVADDSPVRPSSAISITNAVTVVSTTGRTLIETRRDGKSSPLLHINTLGKGQVYYLASNDSLPLLQETIDALAGSRPVTVAPADRQVVLARQDRKNRWILHFLDDGDCSVLINRDFAPPTKIAGQYPAEGWTAKLEKTDFGTRITVGGDAGNRLLVLQ